MTRYLDLNLGEYPHDPKFRELLDTALDEIGFSSVEKLGVLFLSGYTACKDALDNLSSSSSTESEDIEAIEKARGRVALYANSKKYFWDNLDPDKLHNSIYNLNYICHKLASELTDVSLDKNLRLIDGKYTPLKSKVDQDWYSKYSNHSFKLRTVSKIYYDCIRRIGDYLASENISKPDSYSIGVALYGYMQSFDIKGNNYLAGFISGFYPPTFGAVARYSELYQEFPYELSRNHIFSTIFQIHNGYIEETVRAGIHAMHQMVFYDEGTSELRNFWKFKDISLHELLMSSSFRSAAHVKNKYLNFEDFHIEAIIQSGEVFDSNAIGADFSEEELWNLVCGVMSEKYGMFLNVKGWQTIGEFMEFIGILFYETCLHAIVANKVVEQSD